MTPATSHPRRTPSITLTLSRAAVDVLTRLAGAGDRGLAIAALVECLEAGEASSFTARLERLRQERRDAAAARGRATRRVAI